MQADLLDVVIGVVFVWFLLSVMLSAVNEAFTLTTHLRAKHLWLGIGRVLDPQKGKLPRKFLDAAVRLPLRGDHDVRPRAVDDAASAGAGTRRKRVGLWFSERPNRNATGDWAALRERTQELYEHIAPQVVEIAQPGRLSKITHIASEAVSDAVVSLANKVHPRDLLEEARAAGWSTARVNALKRALDSIDDGKALEGDEVLALKFSSPTNAASPEDLGALYVAARSRFTARDVADVLNANPALADAIHRAAAAVLPAEQMKAMKHAIDAHFDREMDQISKFYRRQSRKILALFATIAVLLLQANAVGLALDLWHDAKLRASVASAAIGAAAESSVRTAVATANCGAATTTSTTNKVGTPSPSTTTTSPLDKARNELRCAGDIVGKASQFHVGWGGSDFKNAHGAKGKQAKAETADIWPYLVRDWGWIGRPITALALLFGAQFWFDILRRLVGLRKSAGSSDAKS
jgi:hypothetical protein